MICEICNTNLNNNDKFCYKCGNKIGQMNQNASSVNSAQLIREGHNQIPTQVNQGTQYTTPKQSIRDNEDFQRISGSVKENGSKFVSWIKLNTAKIVEKVKLLSNKQKIVIASLIAVCVIGIGFLSIPQTANHTINKFEKAIIDGDAGKLKKIVTSEDKRVSITEDNLNVIIEYYKNNPSALNSDIEYLKYSDTEGGNTSDDYMPFNLVSKKQLFKEKYYISLKPRYIQLDSPYKNVKIDLSNGKSIVQENIKNGEIGPFLPGQYKLVISSNSEFSEFKKSQVVDIFYADMLSFVTVDANINQTQIISDEESAIIYIDGKSTGKTAKEIGIIPGLQNGVTIYGVFNYEGQEIKSNTATVSGSNSINLNYNYSKPPTLEEVQEEVDKLMNNYLVYFADAVNYGDFTYIEDCISLGSNLYKDQKTYVVNAYERGIIENYINHEIVSVDYDESKKTGTVLVKEVYEIITEDDSREKTFQNRYKFEYNENHKSYKLTDLELNAW